LVLVYERPQEKGAVTSRGAPGLAKGADPVVWSSAQAASAAKTTRGASRRAWRTLLKYCRDFTSPRC
jgi:hypothetical protein